ncbi:MAG: agmatine deiminase family protein [Pseudomonadota bacterium]
MALPTFSTERRLFVPPEEALHEFTFMQWPVNANVHTDRYFLDDLQAKIADIANAIVDFEPVILAAAGEYHKSIRQRVSGAVELVDIPTDDLWARDSGPLIALDGVGNRVVSHLKFNGWGDRQVHSADGLVAERMARWLDFDIVDSGLVGEAGGAEHDGHGLLMAHESSWVHDNRNPGLSRDVIEERLLAAYGAERIIWSPGVRDMDITDYHIDSLARFTGSGQVLLNLPEEPDMSDPFHLAALDTHDALVATGLDVEVIFEPNQRRVQSEDFVASYANYYVCNGAVIAAQFGDQETDSAAQVVLAKHYPGRQIVALNVDALGEIGGGIHCATQQVPAV